MTPASDGLLELASVGKRFGGVTALADVSLHIKHGEIYGLIGPNGAGKTTLFNIVTGLYQLDSGVFDFAGKRYTRCKPHLLAQAGIARTFQNIRLFANMSALENVMVGRHLRTRAGIWGALTRHAAARAEERDTVQRARELLDYVGIECAHQTLAKHLSYGEQRRLEIARALATEPKLLALDEPAAGMNATETVGVESAVAKDTRQWHHRVAHRTRRQTHHGFMRPSCGAGLRQEDRRRHPRRSAPRSCSDRRLPWRGCCMKIQKQFATEYRACVVGALASYNRGLPLAGTEEGKCVYPIPAEQIGPCAFSVGSVSSVA